MKSKILVLITLGFFQAASAAGVNAYARTAEFIQPLAEATDTVTCTAPLVSVIGGCGQNVSMGWVAFGGTNQTQRWETRMMISGEEKNYPGTCLIHATVRVFDPNPLPAGGGTLDTAKQMFVNYVDNRGGNADRSHPKTSTAAGISFDLKNGESVNLTLLSSVDNPLVIQGGSVVASFVPSSLDCMSWRVPMEVNYLAQGPLGYTFNVFQSELSFGSSRKWFVSAEGSPQGSPAGFVDMSLNVYNPSLTQASTVHIEAYDQFGRLVAFTGTSGGVTSAVPDHLLNPLATWSTLLSSVLGSAISNFTGRIYISTTGGVGGGFIMLTAYRRDDLGMSAPMALPTPF